MYKKILTKILSNKEQFIPQIFTQKQMQIMEKYNAGQELTANEKHILYTSLKKKLNALENLFIENNEVYIYGMDKIKEGRIDKAKEIIKKFSPHKVFISGSFLFSEKYNDIDVFIVQEKGYKEIHDGDHHIIKLTQKKLVNPVFQSASMISVSNFEMHSRLTINKLKLSDIMSIYHESLIELLGNRDREATRNLIFNYYLSVEKILLDGLRLKNITDSIEVVTVENMVKKMIDKLFSASYIYVVLHEYVKTLESAIKSEKSSENLKKYKHLYEEMIYEARRGKAEAV